jgi:hypothetical protein
MHIRAITLGIIVLATAVVSPAQNVLHLWQMGEDDAGVANGNPVNANLTAIIGSDLTLNGSGLTYTTAKADDSEGFYAVNFTGSGNYTTASNFGLTTNFGMETWVNFSSLATTQWVMLLGNGASNGAGILLSGGLLKAAKSGDNIYGVTPALSTDTWYHVALVVDENASTSLYLDGNLISGSTFTLGTIASHFGLGGSEDGSARLTGTLDEARIFSFATGTFTTAMLNYPVAVPEPSTYAILTGLAVMGIAAWRWRRV